MCFDISLGLLNFAGCRLVPNHVVLCDGFRLPILCETLPIKKQKKQKKKENSFYYMAAVLPMHRT